MSSARDLKLTNLVQACDPHLKLCHSFHVCPINPAALLINTRCLSLVSFLVLQTEETGFQEMWKDCLLIVHRPLASCYRREAISTEPTGTSLHFISSVNKTLFYAFLTNGSSIENHRNCPSALSSSFTKTMLELLFAKFFSFSVQMNFIPGFILKELEEETDFNGS